MAVTVEERAGWPIVLHGALGGLTAGVMLGLMTIVASLVLERSVTLPFRFTSALLIGPAAFSTSFPFPVALLLGATVHFALSMVVGLVFVWLLALTFQLSARWWLLMLYGAVYGFSLWEVNFLAAVPRFFPFLEGRLDVRLLLWTGVVSYALVYGPVLGAYIALARPGVREAWRRRAVKAPTKGGV